MTLARLFLAALLVYSLPAFTQDQQLAADQNPDNVSAFATNRNVATAEPWRIMPNRTSDFSSNSMDRMRLDQYVRGQGKGDFRGARSKEDKARTLVMGLNGPLDADATCFTIRSYVVARDSKDSDSTHPTGYSTCQPASRCRLKATVEGQVSSQR